jgi:hypothetical protein
MPGGEACRRFPRSEKTNGQATRSRAQLRIFVALEFLTSEHQQAETGDNISQPREDAHRRRDLFEAKQDEQSARDQDAGESKHLEFLAGTQGVLVWGRFMRHGGMLSALTFAPPLLLNTLVCHGESSDKTS